MNQERLDICIQAIWRKSILKTTLQSFKRNLFDQSSYDYKVHCNIDPVGDKETTTNDIKDLVIDYFGKENCNFFLPEYPNFTRAVIRTWQSVESKYFFNLEDDWELVLPIPIDWFCVIMENNPRIASLTIPKKEWKRWFFSQNPSMVRTSWAMSIIDELNHEQSVEHQLDQNTLNGRQLNDLHMCYPYFVGETVVRDIGREWRKKHGFKKTAPNFATYKGIK